MSYFTEPHTHSKNKIDLSNYATKSDLVSTGEPGVDTLQFAKKNDLGNSKSDVDKLDIDKLKNVTSNFSNLKSKVDKLDIGELENMPFDSSKVNGVVKNDVIKKTEFDELVKKVNSIWITDTSDLVKKKKMITTQKLMRLKRKLLMMILVNTLLFRNLLS